jgi:hypothetical protein
VHPSTIRTAWRRGARLAVIAGATALATVLGGPASADPGVSPSVVDGTADPGTSFAVDKVVTTPEIPPKPDVVLAVDTTGSMTGAIENVQANLQEIITDIKAAQPDAHGAVVSYKDFTDPDPFTVVQNLTADEAALQAAVDSLSAAGGGDTPEAWINALFEISTGAISFRPDSSRIVVLIGDASAHDPSGGHTLADAIAALQAAGARVIAVNVDSGGADGLDAAGQATAVVDATGGQLLPSDPDAVTAAVLEGLQALDVTVEPEVVSCDPGLSVSFDKADVTVPSGSTVEYLETVEVAGDAEQGAVLQCTVRFLLDGTPGGDAFIETISVTVNDVTPPVVGCVLGPNPGGHIVPAPQAGFRTLTATDLVDEDVEITIRDTASDAAFGPYPDGTNIKLTQAPGATPQVTPGTGAVDWNVRLKGDAIIEAVDTSGNMATTICVVPPPK